jgi:hypothetical protein
LAGSAEMEEKKEVQKKENKEVMKQIKGRRK